MYSSKSSSYCTPNTAIPPQTNTSHDLKKARVTAQYDDDDVYEKEARKYSYTPPKATTSAQECSPNCKFFCEHPGGQVSSTQYYGQQMCNPTLVPKDESLYHNEGLGRGEFDFFFLLL